MLEVPIHCLAFEQQAELGDFWCLRIDRGQALWHVVSLPRCEESADMCLCVGFLVVSWIWVRHCVDFWILRYSPEWAIVVEMFDLRTTAVGRYCIGRCCWLRFRIRKRLFSECKICHTLVLHTETLFACVVPCVALLPLSEGTHYRLLIPSNRIRVIVVGRGKGLGVVPLTV